jgi:post-segregation antitoxin (ccd killing protein)
MNHLLRSRQSAQVTVDDDSVEAARQREPQAAS